VVTWPHPVSAIVRHDQQTDAANFVGDLCLSGQNTNC
jgi:hypothetical protein